MISSRTRIVTDFIALALTGKLVLVDLAGSENNKVWGELGAGNLILIPTPVDGE